MGTKQLFRAPVRAICENVVDEVQQKSHIKIRFESLFEPDYLPAKYRKAAEANESYTVGQVFWRLWWYHNLGVVYVNEKLFRHSVQTILEFTPKLSGQYVGYGPNNPYVGFFVSMGRNCSLFSASRNMNQERHILSRIHMDVRRIKASFDTGRLGPEAVKAIGSSLKELKKDVDDTVTPIQLQLRLKPPEPPEPEK